ncbi:BH3989 [Halalkalibacterium halodurans C-125]|uniref:BH3989 protein n=2 Tax=Halalkalibacterium halodurans TaxID=86665 RepID=Q9K5U9_HALH5|nr:BH3989 [Halalkalibacterium halodurans C-125]
MVLICTILFILASCESDKEFVSKDWEKSTTIKITSGFDHETRLFKDYSIEDEVFQSVDDIRRQIEIAELINYEYDKSLIYDSLNRLKDPALDNEFDVRENLIMYYLYQEVLEITDEDIDYVAVTNDIIKKKSNDEDEKYVDLDIVYIVVYYFSEQLKEDIKIKIIDWLETNWDTFEIDIGSTLSVLEISHILDKPLNIEFDREHYSKLLIDSTESTNDLLEVYYLVLINSFLENQIDKNAVRDTVLKFYSDVDGFSVSSDYYFDGNLGTFMGLKILKEVDYLELVKDEIYELFKYSEESYGGFVNKANIVSGSAIETIMAAYVLTEFNNDLDYDLSVLIEVSELSWFWSYQYIKIGKYSEKDLEQLKDDLKYFEHEVVNIKESDIEEILNISGLLNEIEYASKLAALIDYKFNEEYIDKMYTILAEANELSISEFTLDSFTQVVSMNEFFDFQLFSIEEVESYISKILKTKDELNFYDVYNILKVAKLYNFDEGEIEQLMQSYINENGGINTVPSVNSDTLHTTFLYIYIMSN